MEIKEAKRTSGKIEISHEFIWHLEKDYYSDNYLLTCGNFHVGVLPEDAEKIMDGNKDVLMGIVNKVFKQRMEDILEFLKLL